MRGASVAKAALLLAISACAASRAAGPEVESTLHPDFGAHAPATVALRSYGPLPAVDELAAVLTQGLFNRRFSVLAPGVGPAGIDGAVRVSLTGAAPPFHAGLTLEDSAGTILYRVEAVAHPGPLPQLAADLLRDLPPR